MSSHNFTHTHIHTSRYTKIHLAEGNKWLQLQLSAWVTFLSCRCAFRFDWLFGAFEVGNRGYTQQDNSLPGRLKSARECVCVSNGLWNVIFFSCFARQMSRAFLYKLCATFKREFVYGIYAEV